MKLSHIAIALMAAAAFSSTASGAFFIEDSSIVGTERGQMGKFQPYDAQGKATFVAPSGGTEPKQARYKDAELLVDLAYTPLSQRGSGEPGMVPGFGDGIPFDSAMSMILPSGWQVYKSKDLDRKVLPEQISFSGGRTWPEVLKQVGDRYELHFHIDWYDRTIMITKGRKSMAMTASLMRVVPEPVKAAPSIASTATGQSKPNSFAVGSSTTTPANEKVLGGVAVMAPASTPKLVQVGGAKAFAATAAAPSKPAAPPIATWIVSSKDKTIRDALKSWTNTANWTFEPEHWAVPVDIPLTAGATFSGDFKTAVRQLIATTELGDTPLQPCFYLNRVVRVVPINQVCDQMSAR